MKTLKRVLLFSAVALLGIASMQAVTAAANSNHVVLKPSMEQRYATNLVTRFLTNWHYKDTALDDALSAKIFDKYIELLDPNRAYFTDSDIYFLKRHKKHLDDALTHYETGPAFEIFNVYVERVAERMEYSHKLLEGEFDFTIEEEYSFDRSEADWLKDKADWQDLWRKRIKNDYLRLKLTGKEPEAIVSTLTDRYNNMERRIMELNEEDVFQFFMNSVTQSIEPHTSYLSPRNSANFEITMKLSLEGIGALLERQTEYTGIARVVAGGPADLDGRLQIGDRIIGVAQGLQGKMEDVIGWRLDDVVDLIRGPKDSVVRLEVLPADAGVDAQSTVIDLVRNEVKLEEQAAKSSIIDVPRGDEIVKIGLIDVPVFYLDFAGRQQNRPDYRSSTRDVKNLIIDLKKEGVEGIIIDLRNNGGGSLLEATTLTGLFIDQGPVVQVRDSRGRISVERDTDPGMTWQGPMAVLVNRYSASASEIFAGAIQDYGRGLILGEPTFGKGTVQNLIDLDDYSGSESSQLGQLKLTMAQFFRVNGNSTQNLGVTPDIIFPYAGNSADYGESSLDNALPFSKIDPATYEPAGDLHSITDVLDFRYDMRISQNAEFAYLLADIEEYNSHADRVTISLVESVRRTEMEAGEAKAARRKQERKELAENGGMDVISPTRDLSEESDSVSDDPEAEEDDDEQIDLLLNEAARVVSDLIELEGNSNLLAHELEALKLHADPAKLN